MKKSILDLNEIRKVDWEYFANRNNPILFWSITDRAYQNFPSVTGIPWKITHRLHLGDGEFYNKTGTFDALRKIFSGEKEKILRRFQGKLVTNIKNLEAISKKIEQLDARLLAQNSLAIWLEKFLAQAFRAHIFLQPMVIAGQVLSDIILDLLPNASFNQRTLNLFMLTQPRKESVLFREQAAFLRLLEKYQQKHRDFPRLLNNHLKKFGWIGARGYWLNREWTLGDILERLEISGAKNLNPTKQFWMLRQQKKQELAQAEKLIREMKIRKNPSLLRLIRLAQDFVFLRTWRTDTIYHSGFRIRNILYEIARRAGLRDQDVLHLTCDEILAMARNREAVITEDELKRRRKYFVMAKIKDKDYLLSGRKWKKIIEKIIKSRLLPIKFVKGNSVYPGKATGKVKIVKSVCDVKKVTDGDILVAVMTFPNFIAAMERAAAFVTDEGGILCHAAVVARELKKPCVIGTKIATKVFKDGDMVEVDANKGIVRKL